MTTFFVMVLKPFGALILFTLAIPGRLLAQKLPDGRLKRLLLLKW
jgi:hypothetical protein